MAQKSVEPSVVRSTSRGSCIAYCCRTDNVRAHADMNNHHRKETCINNRLFRKGYNSCLQGLLGLDVITPGTSTVDYIRDNNSDVCKIRLVSNTASSKRLHYVLDHILNISHRKPALCSIIISDSTTLGTA